VRNRQPYRLLRLHAMMPFLSISLQAKLVECYTQPPDYLTEAELISLMEKHGIGTDASIPVHINNICIRNYVNVATGRKLVPTSLGIVLVHGYQKVFLLLTRYQQINNNLTRTHARVCALATRVLEDTCSSSSSS
jgi:reverse gyrase